MALNINTSAQLRGNRMLTDLAEAVYNADNADESDWIEWKGSLDLTSRSARFAIARYVIGSANRMPDIAARTAGGLGYLLVGVQPGAVLGVTPVDSADWSPAVDSFLGSPTPAWTPLYLRFQDKHVLAITVEPPQWGNPIFATGKDFQPENDKLVQAPAIFVRRGSETQRVNVAEFEGLQRRLASSSKTAPKLNLAVKPHTWPESFAVLNFTEEAVKDWIIARAKFLWTNKKDQPIQTSADPQMRNALRMYNTMYRDQRTREQYDDEVSQHLNKCETVLEVALPNQFAKREYNLISFKVINDTATNYPDTALAINVSGNCWVVDPLDLESWTMPKPPHPFGTRDRDFLMPDHFRPPMPHLPSSNPGISIENTEYNRATFHFGNIRPFQTSTSVDLCLIIVKDHIHDQETVQLDWILSSGAIDAANSGSINVPLTKVVSPHDLVPPNLSIPRTLT